MLHLSCEDDTQRHRDTEEILQGLLCDSVPRCVVFDVNTGELCDQSTTSPRPPQLNPSSGRLRLTISALNSPVTRDGLPTIVTSSPGLSDSLCTPDLANCEVPAHSSDQRRMVPLSSGAWTVTKE